VTSVRRFTWLLLLALAACALAPAALRAQADDGLGLDDSNAETDADKSTPSGEPEQTQPTQQPSEQAAAQAESAPPSEPEEASTVPRPKSGERALSLYAGAGAGVGTLMFQRPTSAGVQKLPQTPFAAAEIQVRGHMLPKNRFSLEVLFAYQTSLGLVLQASPLFALPQNTPARWQHLEISVAPVIRLRDGADAPALAFPVGMLYASMFAAERQSAVPRYTFGGPQLRAELQLELSKVVRLRLGPEIAWLALVSHSLTEAGACCQGMAFGARGALEARAGEAIRVALTYAESHAFVPAGSWRFSGVDRFLTVRLAGEL